MKPCLFNITLMFFLSTGVLSADLVYHVPIHKTIDLGLPAFIERAIADSCSMEVVMSPTISKEAKASYEGLRLILLAPISNGVVQPVIAPQSGIVRMIVALLR